MSDASKSQRRITPHSRLLRRGCVDGRSREGRFLAAARAELVEHLGGAPTPAERVLIDRLAWLRLRVALYDEQMIAGRPFTEYDQRAYLAFSNAIARGAAALGLKSRPAPKPSLAEYLASRARNAGEAA
ncbi:MAG TPA: hypothetical protein VFA12_10140 [Stellaceae bacterium]|nr:hypothetical protein [Stellaceae bacterium]